MGGRHTSPGRTRSLHQRDDCRASCSRQCGELVTEARFVRVEGVCEVTSFGLGTLQSNLTLQTDGILACGHPTFVVQVDLNGPFHDGGKISCVPKDARGSLHRASHESKQQGRRNVRGWMLLEARNTTPTPWIKYAVAAKGETALRIITLHFGPHTPHAPQGSRREGVGEKLPVTSAHDCSGGGTRPRARRQGSHRKRDVMLMNETIARVLAISASQRKIWLTFQTPSPKELFPDMSVFQTSPNRNPKEMDDAVNDQALDMLRPAYARSCLGPQHFAM